MSTFKVAAAEACLTRSHVTRKNKSPVKDAPEPITITWKKWPPPVAPVPNGLKIPVKIAPDLIDPCHDYVHDQYD